MVQDESETPDYIENVVDGGAPGDVLGEYRDEYYILKEAPDGSCVVIVRYDADSGGKQIAYIDNSDHWDDIDTEYHLHEPGAGEPEPFEGNIDDAYEELRDNWKKYVDMYLDK